MFNQDSKLVKDYVFLIQKDFKTIDDVPEYSNLKDMVSSVLAA